MAKKPALGRGLDALMPFSEEEYGKAKRRRDSKIEEIRRKKEERATKESLDVYELNL